MTDNNHIDVRALEREQETCLKQQLLKYSIQQEIGVYFASPTNIDNTLFLRFMKERILDFPLWNKRPNARSKCLELINSLPELVVQSQKATKRDPENRGLRRVVAKCYDMALRTQQEKQHDIDLESSSDSISDIRSSSSSLSSSSSAVSSTTTTTTPFAAVQAGGPLPISRNNSVNSINPPTTPTTSNPLAKSGGTSSTTISDHTRFSLKARAQKEMNEMAQTILAEAETQGGYQYLFRKIKAAPKITDLPQSYQSLAKHMCRSLALWMEDELRDPDQLSKLQRLEKMTPTRTIRAALSIANPISLMQGLISIFLARPFGARNLVQKFAEQMVEIKRTEASAYKIQKELDHLISHRKVFKGNFRKQIIAKIDNYVEIKADRTYDDDDDEDEDDYDDDDDDGDQVEEEYLDIPHIRKVVASVVNNEKIDPVFDTDDINKLTLEDEIKIYQLYQLKRRYREKQEFVELLGDEKLISIIKEILPVIHEPMSLLFARSNIGHHFDALFKTAKRAIKITLRCQDTPFSSRLAEYEKATERFISDMYSFLHTIASQDDQTLDETLGWLMNLLHFTRNKHLDMLPILNSATPIVQSSVLKEVNALIEYRHMLIAYEDGSDNILNHPSSDSSGLSAKEKQKEEEEIPEPPEVTYIPRLVNKFVTVVREILVLPSSSVDYLPPPTCL